MRTFVVRKRWSMIVFSALSAWLVVFYSWINETFTAPLNEPITLSSVGQVNRDIRIRIDAPYNMQLVFSAGTRSREEAMRLVDDDPSCQGNKSEQLCGTSVPLRWTITDLSGRVVASGETETRGLTSFGSADFSRTVARPIDLPAGRYRFSASVLRDLPEIHGMTARLSLTLPGPKTSFGWQSDLAFFGGYLNFFLILPTTGIVGLSLLVQASEGRARGRRGR